MYTLSLTDTATLCEHVAFSLTEPVMIWGPPGVGKSQMAAQLATKMAALLVDIRLSQYDSVDLRGFPQVDVLTQLTTWCAPSTLPFVGNAKFEAYQGPILLFLDEINAAPPAVAAVAYQLINDRCVGEHRLLDNVVVIAAGNREGDRGVTNRQPLPLANRFTHVEVIADVESWSKWAASEQLPPVGIAFLNFRKPLISTFDPAKPDKAFATPRTWAKAFRYYAASMPDHIKMAAMAGAVGEGPSAEFWGFVDVWAKVIPIAKVLADPTGTPVPEEQSMQYAMAVSVSGAMSAKNVTKLHAYIRRFDPEFVVLAWQLAVRRDKALYATPEFMAFSKEHRAIFTP
jgi:hypothetical protein